MPLITRPQPVRRSPDPAPSSGRSSAAEHVVVTTATDLGRFSCSATHKDSGAVLTTAAPLDNQGDGSSFSPTDLVGVALGTCMLTTMSMKAKSQGYAIDGATVTTEKRMSPPPRRIRQLKCVFRLPAGLSDEQLAELQRVAEACPVKRSLHPDGEVVVAFETA